jgi:hypothetical protein
MAAFFNEDQINLLAQDREQFESLRRALETDRYEFYYAVNPTHPNATIDIFTPADGWIHRINLGSASWQMDEAHPRGTPIAFSCFTCDVIYFPVPARIRAFLDAMTSYEYRSSELLEDWERRSVMGAEATRDPEGAFGGRGNNFPISGV